MPKQTTSFSSPLKMMSKIFNEILIYNFTNGSICNVLVLPVWRCWLMLIWFYNIKGAGAAVSFDVVNQYIYIYIYIYLHMLISLRIIFIWTKWNIAIAYMCASKEIDGDWYARVSWPDINLPIYKVLLAGVTIMNRIHLHIYELVV